MGRFTSRCDTSVLLPGRTAPLPHTILSDSSVTGSGIHASSSALHASPVTAQSLEKAVDHRATSPRPALLEVPQAQLPRRPPGRSGQLPDPRDGPTPIG